MTPVPASDSPYGLPPAAPKWVRLPSDPPLLRAELEREQAEAEMGELPPVPEEPPA